MIYHALLYGTCNRHRNESQQEDTAAFRSHDSSDLGPTDRRRVTAAYMYSNHLKQSMVDQLDAKWQNEAEQMKADYTAQLTALSGEVKDLQSKVEAFNELLEFTKDNSSEKTDNSNKLYSQLSEVKQQLAALQKKWTC
ncbi:hypothetical protein HMSSN139_35190 [Paenibacillus sp. HMSSN-139]|nr:hypothetical protein HMSSN139_35190 [Paenibacillus sp. HMSSN-139]